MCPFDYLILAHLVGDYLLQTEYEALNKATGRFWNRALVSHCIKYTLCFLPVFWLTSINAGWLIPLWLSHMFLDRRWPVILWRRYVMAGQETTIKNTFLLTIVVDQIFHIIILALVKLLAN